MGDEKLSEHLKKNLLDLQYTRYLQYFNTSIIIIFTYFIGLGLSLVTKQVDLGNVGHIFLLVSISLVFLGIMLILLFNFKKHMNNILKEIKKLKL